MFVLLISSNVFQIDLIDIFEYANAQITADGSSQKIII